MKVISLRSVMALAIAALYTVALTPLAAGSIEYAVSVDTSSLNGIPGFLDFQFNPGNGSTQSATAQMLGFSGGTLTGVPSNTGDVTGTLPGTVTFVNTTALNESYQGFTFGLNYSFFLLLSGLAIDAPNGTSTAGSTFGFGIYDAGSNSLFTNQGASTGYAGQVDINLDGTSTATVFPNAVGGPSVVSLTQITSPEPGSLFLLGLGVTVLIGLRKFVSC